MIAGLDSSFAKPTPGQALAARAAGVRIWSGYLTTRPNVGIAAPWSQADFDNARLCGADPIAYCSGWDDAAALKAKAAAWRVRLCLDCEGGIRGDGPWVQGFLDASGAGLYGNPPVFPGRHAPFFIDAAYPGYDPGRTWPSGNPGVLHGWQWEGTHLEFGAGVDRGWFDDGFLQGAEDMAQLDDVLALLLFGADGAFADAKGNPQGWTAPEGKGHLTRVSEVMLANQKEILLQLAAQKAELDGLVNRFDKLSGGAAVDPKALAGQLAPLLPHLSPADIDTVLKAVSGKLAA